MAETPVPQPVGVGETLLDAYELVLEAIREGGGADELLRRALAVVATIPWPTRHRLFTAFIVAVLFAFRPGSGKVHRDSANIPFRHDDKPAADTPAGPHKEARP